MKINIYLDELNDCQVWSLNPLPKDIGLKFLGNINCTKTDDPINEINNNFLPIIGTVGWCNDLSCTVKIIE